MSRSAALRLALAALGLTILGACASPTAPTSKLRAPVNSHNDGVPVDSSSSGFVVPHG